MLVGGREGHNSITKDQLFKKQIYFSRNLIWAKWCSLRETLGDENYSVMKGVVLQIENYNTPYKLCKENLKIIKNVQLFYQRNLRKVLVALVK